MELVKIKFMDTRFYEDLFKQGGVVSSYQPDRQVCPKYGVEPFCIIACTYAYETVI